MTFDAIITKEGTVIAEIPENLRGKKVKITIHEGRSKKLSQWEKMSAILEKVDALDIHRRTIDEILDDIHTFRENS
jgi:hypothetical protein